jgi:hypothetical protein
MLVQRVRNGVARIVSERLLDQRKRPLTHAVHLSLDVVGDGTYDDGEHSREDDG